MQSGFKLGVAVAPDLPVSMTFVPESVKENARQGAGDQGQPCSGLVP